LWQKIREYGYIKIKNGSETVNIDIEMKGRERPKKRWIDGKELEMRMVVSE